MYTPLAFAAWMMVCPGVKGISSPSRWKVLVSFAFMLLPRLACSVKVRGGIVAAGHLPRLRQGGVEVEGRLVVQATSGGVRRRAELVERVEHRVAGGIAQPAVAGALHQAVQLEQLVDVVGRAVAGCARSCPSCCAPASCRPGRGCRSRRIRGRRSGRSCAPPRTCRAWFVEDHEGAGGGQVLEGDPAVELVLGEADAGWAGNLHRQGIGGAAVLQHLAHGDAVGIFVDARPLAVAADGKDLGAGGFFRAIAAYQAPPCSGDQAGRGQVSTLFTVVGWSR
jgi:hypothetical protein